MSRSTRGLGTRRVRGDVTPKPVGVLEEMGMAGEEFPHHLIVGVLALGVPHLLVAAESEKTWTASSTSPSPLRTPL